jgi:two-component system sensor histidine kinase PilS (NtrC family)
MVAMDSILRSARSVRHAARAAVETENWRLLRLFNYYRLAIGLAATGVALTVGTLPPFGSDAPGLFQFTSILYFTLGIAALGAIYVRRPDFESQATLLGFGDITLLTVLIHSSGGVGSGVELLLLVAIAGISLMLGRRITLFYASVAAIAILLQHGWRMIIDAAAGVGGATHGTTENFPQAGLFGLGLYATAFVGYTLASRLRATEALAEKRSVDLANLAQINELIIQRLTAGVLVCDNAGQVRMMNQAAERFLGPESSTGQTPRSLSDLAPDLAIQLFQWSGKKSAPMARRVVRSRRGYMLLPRFVGLGDERETGTLIFLEDMSILKQQAQQLKMAALARLTASIAHEIRNPLGALSNAAQLLAETATGNEEEKRLLKIIDEQSRRMNVIVQNVTQLSRRDKVNPVRLALDTWLEEFVRQYSETVFVPREAFVRPLPTGLNICFDPEQLYQVISNLCQNALRASPPYSGTALIKFHASLDTEGRACLDVIDWGKGVSPEIADNIFDPFFTTTPKGTGLGLYIARELCEGNGGSLDYRPGEGAVGSIFRVTFARSEECAELGAV